MSREDTNKAVQLRYDELMREGKHGHYETLFKVVHEQVQACEAEQSKRIAELVEAVTYARSQLLMVVNDINNDRVPFDGDEFHETLEKCDKALAKVKDE